MVYGEECWAACVAHPRLTHYRPGHWVREGVWRVNRFLHDRRINASDARAISRLLVGGQPFRGGDVCSWEVVTQFNCCVWCLVQGVKAVESLEHAVYFCPEYQAARADPFVQRVLADGGGDIFEFHRNRWKWSEMRHLRSFFLDIVRLREEALGRKKCKAAELQQVAEAHWFE